MSIPPVLGLEKRERTLIGSFGWRFVLGVRSRPSPFHSLSHSLPFSLSLPSKPTCINLSKKRKDPTCLLCMCLCACREISLPVQKTRTLLQISKQQHLPHPSYRIVSPFRRLCVLWAPFWLEGCFPKP